MGRLAVAVATDKLTATWQFSFFLPPPHSSAPPAALRPAPAATYRHRSKATARQNDAMTRACAAHGQGLSAPPWAQRSSARRPVTDPCSNSAEVRCDPHAPRLAPATPYMPRGVSLVALAQEFLQPREHYTTVFVFMTQ